MLWTPERAKAYSREWYLRNRETQIAKATARNAANPEARRASWMRSRLKKYGLTLEQYDAMRAEQGYSCAICECPEENAPKQCLVVDHSHDTGKVRRLLCTCCNALLGMAREDLVILERAIEYLRSE